MDQTHKRPTEGVDGPRRLLVLSLLSLVVGATAGLIGVLFRLALEQADNLRNSLVTQAHGSPLIGFVSIVAACTLATSVATWLVRRFSPHASGSGIPHVEAVLNQELPPAPLRLIPVKFFGGLLAIGSGLALGREGPSVQMGAGLAHSVGMMFRRDWADRRALMAAGAGAGLATAFNAPIAGAAFVLEELVRRFETRIAIAALGASATAISVARVFLGDSPDFHVEPLNYAAGPTIPLYFLLGLVAGLLGIAYNRTLLGTIAAVERLSSWPVELRAAMIGAAIGVVAWYLPSAVGGGEAITQSTLARATKLSIIPFLFLLRFGLGSISYAAKTPGGLFAPMLVLGAELGLLFGALCQSGFSGSSIQPEAFAVVGMAAFFAAVVRAPITGIVLVTEMSGSFTMLLPMLAACFAAMLVTTACGNPPIYESLREQSPQTLH